MLTTRRTTLLLLLVVIAAVFVARGEDPEKFKLGGNEWKRFATTIDYESQLAQNKGLIIQAAQFALQVYDDSNNENVVRHYDNDGNSVAIQAQAVNGVCYFALASGKSTGFEWMNTNVDWSVAKMRSPSNGRKCRVVRHYKNLHYSASYREHLLVAAQTCLESDNMQVVFTGHDVGGAIATLYGLSRLSVLQGLQSRMWLVTFGQPPVFVPKRPNLLGRIPCSGLYYPTYLRVINSEPNGVSGGLGYDFMPYLNEYMASYCSRNTLAEKRIEDIFPDCLQYSVQSLAFMLQQDNSEQVSLGAPWGGSIVLPPTPASSKDNPKHLYQHRATYYQVRSTFRNANQNGINAKMLLVPDVCFDSRGTIHGMDEYYRKLLNFQDLDDPAHYSGFAQGMPCNFDVECNATMICVNDKADLNLFRTCQEENGHQSSS